MVETEGDTAGHGYAVRGVCDKDCLRLAHHQGATNCVSAFASFPTYGRLINFTPRETVTGRRIRLRKCRVHYTSTRRGMPAAARLFNAENYFRARKDALCDSAFSAGLEGFLHIIDSSVHSSNDHR